MAQTDPIPPKPVTEKVRPEITFLPKITFWRRLARRLWRVVCRFLLWVITDLQITGMEHFPLKGGALLVSNHLGDFDFLIGIAHSPRIPDAFVKADLYDYPVLGLLLRAYGVIWIHRGQPDRRAIRAAIDGMKEGRVVAIAPEGRESLTGALEEGTHGAAYLALKADVPIMPGAFTGSENSRIIANIKRFRRTKVNLIIGPMFRIEPHVDRHTAIERGTQVIMQKIARMLPSEYRGVYQGAAEESFGS